MAIEIRAKSGLYYHKRTFASNWDLNIYRGCAHRCRYCFAQYSHRYLTESCFFDEIYVKVNSAELLERELSGRKWKGALINICGVSDAYQPAEKQYQLMPEILKILIKFRNPLVLSTKSTLILRDIELIEELARVARVEIGTSVTTFDEALRQKLEPGAAPTEARLKMLAEMKKAGCSTTVLAMPIIPFMTDHENNLDRLFAAVKRYGFDHLITWALHLRGNTKPVFLKFIRENYRELLPQFIALYKGSTPSKEYVMTLGARVMNLRRKYGLYEQSPPPAPRKDQQFELFD